MRRLSFVALVALPAMALAQKKVLTQADWDRWKSISGGVLSNDGRWAAYSLAPLVGDGDLILRSTSGSTEYRVPRGYLGRPNNVPGALRPRNATGNPEEEPGGPGIAPAQFTPDSRFALVLTYPTQVEFDRVARDRRRAAAVQGRSDLAIVKLADGSVSTVARVRSFRIPRSSGAWIAYVVSDSTGDSTARGAGAAGAPAARSPRRRFGSSLVLRNMTTAKEDAIADVLDYTFDDSAKVLAYTVVSRNGVQDGAYVKNLTTGAVTALLTGPGDYDQVAVDRSAAQFAFVSNKEEFGKPDACFVVYHATAKDGAARAVATESLLGGLRVSATANVQFTRSGTALTFGIARPMQDTLTADSLVGKSSFDLWHYKDKTLQPAQKLTAARDLQRSFTTIYQIATKKLVRLANDSIPQVSVSDDGRVALASSSEKYMIERMWGDDKSDVYLIDAQSGAIRVVREKSEGSAQLSTDGKYVLVYDVGQWYAYPTTTLKPVSLTASVRGVSFARENYDMPAPKPSWGVAGWTKGDRTVLLYDRWDVWEMDPTGVRAPVMVTDSLGRKNHLVLRVETGRAPGGFGGGGGGGGGAAARNDEERGIDPEKPLLLRATDDETKASGFYRDQLGVVRAPERIVMADVAFGNVLKAANAEQYLVTKGTFVEFPNLYTGSSLASLMKISDANPQQKDYNWGTVELVRWTSTDGVPLKGLLYKPENFDPNKKYPMIAYFYEQLSQNLHSYIPPNGRNVINPTHYASNGYLVFEPDIHYEEGYPGPSAMKSIVPGVQMLLARGYVDPKALGLQGQSWGGYQTLFMITQTHMFSAAMAGAPVVNMTSAYGGIRWGSGLARAFQYEVSQSRIGGSIWEQPMRYFENSPLFWLDKVTTPLFAMANDADDAVPWYQGIELFVGMRRLGKEVYMVTYNNDVHNPASRANQKDVAMRMQQFFDNKLRGMPAPDWMTKGVPYLSKGRDQVPVSATPMQAGTPNP